MYSIKTSASAALSDRLTGINGVVRAYALLMADRAQVADLCDVDLTDEAHLGPLHGLVADLIEQADEIAAELYQRAQASDPAKRHAEEVSL